MITDLFELANDVLRQADIVEVASHFIKLEKRGNDYVSLCPFHDDKNIGNFSINKEKGIYKCFSCGAGGNAISFVQKYTHCTFSEAIRKTAEIIGYRDERLNGVGVTKEIDPKIQKLYNCLSDISNFYQSSLFQAKDSKDALDYLHNRGLDDETIRYFKIGYAQKNGENIINFLIKKGYSLQTIADAGILRLDQIPYKDINNGRIAFTITDKDNRVVGFSCRKFIEGDNNTAKYINTSATTLFKKSSTLFNYYNAINESRRVGYVYLLEGFMDVIACHRVGIKSAIALMGTALTIENIQLLRYLKCEIRVCLDKDMPGQLNTQKILSLLDEAKIKYSVVNNNSEFAEKDSDEILNKHGEEALRSYLTNLISHGEWLVNFYTKTLNLSTLEGRKKFLLNMLPFLASLKSPLDLDEYTKVIISKTGFDKEIIQSYISKYIKKLDKKDSEALAELKLVQQRFGNKDKVLSKLNLCEKQILRYMLESKDAVKQYQEHLGFFTDTNYYQIATCIEEYLVHVDSKIPYSAQNLVAYLSTDECEIKNKDDVINNISSIIVDSGKIPPYSKEGVEDIIQTISIEKNEKRINQDYISSSQGKSDLEKAELAKATLLKKKMLILNNDKKRR